MAWGLRLFKRAGTGALVLAAFLLPLVPAAAAAQAPDEAWRTITTEHFRVTFPEGLESLARKAADRAERARVELSERFLPPPDGVIDILLTDHTDSSNGYAQVYPSNRITIFARPPVDLPSVGYTDEWLEHVITHELAHVVHLDHVRNPIGRAARGVFGRVNADWPFFPELGTPRWLIEGLATWYESDVTDAGRIRGTYLEMELRTAVLEGRFESIGQAGGESPLWPSDRPYAYGSLFFEFLLKRHGPETMTAFADAIAGQWVPYRLNSAAKDAFGVSLSDEWNAWRDSLEADAGRLDDRLRRTGPITEPERLTYGARWGQHPAVSPDGRWLAFTRADGRSDTQIRLRNLETGVERSLGRTNGLATFSWMPDGRVLLAQFELSGPYRTYQDLYVQDPDGGRERLTEGARVEQPSVSPDGARAVAVRQGDGTNGLVHVDLSTGAVTDLVSPDPDVNWAFPRWSPDGRWVAATRWTPGGEHDVVILDAERGTLVHRVTDDRALDLAPSWSTDGRWLVWGSDRSGIPNVLAARVDPATGRAGAPLALTNLRTGADYPSVSRGTLYFSGYHVDGWEVERVPFLPDQARPAAPAVGRFARTMPPPAEGEAGGPVVPYSAAATLLPTYWEVSYREALAAPAIVSDSVPLGRREVVGFSLGIETGGRDLVGRHAWSALARMSTSGSRFEGAASYAFLGLGNPLLSLSLRQTYPEASQLVAAPDTLVLLRRRRAVDGAVSLLAPRWRRDVSLTLRGGLAWDHRELLDPRLEPSTQYRLDRPNQRLATYGAALNVNTSRTHAFQMGIARGMSVYLFGGVEQELAVPDSLSGVAGADATLGEVLAQVRAALPLWGGGFARHTLALRGSFGAAQGPGAGPLRYRVGGASGRLEDLTGLELFGGTPIFFPVRGYETSSRFGRYAWSATAEYRFPLWIGNVGFGAWPLHLDRTIGSIFFDAGNAWGPDLSSTGFANPMRTALASVGGEVTTEVLGLWDVVLRMRAGAGLPLVERTDPLFWVRVGLPF